MTKTAQLTPVDVQRADATVRPQSREAQRSETRRRAKSRPHVLLVDVDPLSRARFGRSLVQANVDVTVASSIDEAVRACDDTTIGALVLLTTVSEPSFDLVPFLEAIADAAPELAIVARSHSPEAYDLFLRSFGFTQTAVFGVDAHDGAKRLREIIEGL